MRSCLIFLLSSLCAALAQEVLTVPLVDKTGAGNPFQVSGRLLLSEAVRANELEWSWGENVVVKNVSGKPILLFVATLMEIGRHRAAPGRHSSPGNGPTYQLEDDRFFSEKLIKPGESLVLRDTAPGTPDVACCIDASAETRDPSAEFRVYFIQFADGSTFGDPADAREALAMRQMIVSGLRELLDSYSKLGAAGFAATLTEQSPFSTTAICRQILTKYNEDGIRSALDRTEQILTTAERHAAAIAGTATASQSPEPNR